MAILVQTCPHCLAEKMTFQSWGTSHKLAPEQSGRRADWVVPFACAACGGVICAEIKIVADKRTLARLSDPAQLKGNIANAEEFRVEAVYPEPAAVEVPEGVPAEVTRVYVQAVEAVARGEKARDLAGMGFRKVLDLATKALDPKLEGTLGPRIKKLASDGKLTREFADWCQDFKDDGNEFTHDSVQPTVERLRMVADFTELFLKYTFTLPDMIKRRRDGKNTDT